ncbi:hypothetical protein QYE76_027347 [Lolium multiflorum]|uniref:Retrotransposon protein, putative, Ty3-gypsy subclass n=1 Tax=Lolium multiflorum TaxID=4521 RepID=A0AAD8QM73_LOLMU|nr:hypothetical protein QYE76_027347 [Lolium multiflorum]
MHGLQRGGLLRHKLTCLVNANKLTLDEMINIASDHTAADDDAGGDLAATTIPLHQQKKNRDNGVSNSNKRKNPPEDQKGGGSDMVAMTFQRGGSGGGRGRGRGGGAGRGQQPTRSPQRIPRPQTEPGSTAHAAKEARARTRTEEDSSEAMDEDDASPEPKEGTAANKSNPFGKKSVGTYHTFLGTPTVRAKKSALRILNATVPAVPQDVKWSEKACTFDRSDHPAVIPKECYALVVSPRIDGIKLPVAFGNVNNYREEMITFEVVPFKSSYHVIFGRPTYHKFHARACYIYNKLKIPGPNGMITVSGDYKKARDCEEGEAAFAESVISGEELQGYEPRWIRLRCRPPRSRSPKKSSFKAAIETKKHDLVEGATYQRTMQRCLKDQIGRNVHAYVDDIAVMTRKGSDLLSDLKETFDNLRWYKMIFVSRLGEKALPLYKLLKKTDKFVWDEAADEALQELKNILSSPPILAAPAESEPMLLYMAATNKVISLKLRHGGLRDEVDEIAKCFLGYEVKYVRRDDNTAADMLSKLGSGRKPIPPGLEHLRCSSPLRLRRSSSAAACLSFAARRTYAAPPPDLVVRGPSAAPSSSAPHSCFSVTFTASPSAVLVGDRRSVPSPAKLFLSDRDAQG